MDVLADRLTRARAQGGLFAHSTLAGGWGLEIDGGTVALSVHAVLAGELWCEAAGETTRVRAGELVLLPGPGPHRLLARPGAAALSLAEMSERHGVPGRPGRVVMEARGATPATELLCGAYTFHGSLCDSLLAAIPAVAVVPAQGDRLGRLLGLLQDELADDAPGRQVMLDRLLDLLLVSSLRSLWAAPGGHPPPWFAALDDPVVGPALRAMHAEPAHGWTIARLAQVADVSRAALARRFSALVGVPPLAYLTGWRMQLAREALQRPGATLASVAGEVGYSTEYAFAAAFKREVGLPPGRWRAQAA